MDDFFFSLLLVALTLFSLIRKKVEDEHVLLHAFDANLLSAAIFAADMSIALLIGTGVRTKL